MNRRTQQAPLPPELVSTMAASIAGEPLPPPRNRALRERVLARLAGVRSSLVTIRADEGQWVPLAPGVGFKLLHQDAAYRSFLLRLAPGAELAPHDHKDDEECVVLQGEARLGDVRVAAGDYHLAPKGVPHGRIVSATGALLFLRAAI